jgi:Family of unknown function (DUF6152)
MKISSLLTTCGAVLMISPHVLAHHGWSSFDETAPIMLSGTVKKAKWENPHVELSLAPEASAKKCPALKAPKQRANVDFEKLAASAKPPKKTRASWEIELAPLSRVEQWKLKEIKVGEPVTLIGYSFKDEAGEAVLRAEFVIRDCVVTPLRSGPAD